MIGTDFLVRAVERRIGEDAGYMRDLAAVSSRAFWRFVRLSRFAAYRRYAPKTLIHLARIGATMAEDCGPCTRIALRLARQDGVADAHLRAAIQGGKALQGEEALAFHFGHAISGNDVLAADKLGDAIESRLGRKVRTELALAAATTRIFPALKRGLGYAQSCSITGLDTL